MRTLSLLLPLSSLALLAVALPAAGTVKTEDVEYTHGEQVCAGFLAFDDAAKGKRPGVVVVHDWMGISGETQRRTKQLAELGYVALAADIYGKGTRPKDTKEAGALAGTYKGDLSLLRGRARAAFDALVRDPRVDASRVFVIGYCFGGTTALELARSGAPLAGAVSFHGGLGTKDPADAKNVKCPLLVLHGAADPWVPATEVAGFQKEMSDAKVDWQMVSYSGAVHAFTNPAAGDDPTKGAAYDAKADRRSWEAMKAFFAERTR